MNRPDIAAKVAVLGMRDGTFTHYRLGNYIHGSSHDFTDARRIINDSDRSREIAGYADRYLPSTLITPSPPLLTLMAVIMPAPGKRTGFCKMRWDTRSAERAAKTTSTAWMSSYRQEQAPASIMSRHMQATSLFGTTITLASASTRAALRLFPIPPVQLSFDGSAIAHPSRPILVSIAVSTESTNSSTR